MPEYIVGGTVYTQQTLVIGQVEELMPLLMDLKLDGEVTVQSIMMAFKDRLMKAVAIVLRDTGKEKWWDRDTDALAERFRWEMDTETAAAIVTDFFVCNPVESLLQQFGAMNRAITDPRKATTMPNSSASSPAATSRKKKR